MTKIKTNLSSSYNKTISFGVNGKMIEVSFNQDGESEIDDSIVDDLLKIHYTQLEEIKSSPKKKLKEESELNEKKETEEDNQKSEVINSLKEMSFNELKNMAEQAKLPKKQWDKLNQEDLIIYLSTK